MSIISTDFFFHIYANQLNRHAQLFLRYVIRRIRGETEKRNFALSNEIWIMTVARTHVRTYLFIAEVKSRMRMQRMYSFSSFDFS
jgi:hypothetical protein